MAEIKVILWDIGGVIQQDDAMPARKLGIGLDEYKNLIQRSSEYREYILGHTNIGSVAKALSRSLGWEGEEKFQQVKDAILSNWEPPRKEVVRLIGRTKAGCRRMILSNSSFDWERKVREAHEKEYAPAQQYLHLFREEDIIFSHRIGAAKPHPDAFEAVWVACSINPEHWLYIDDRENNLTAAVNYGVEQTILYTRAAQLRKDLAAKEVLGSG